MNPLLPLAYDQSRSTQTDRTPLLVTPKDRYLRDINSHSKVHGQQQISTNSTTSTTAAKQMMPPIPGNKRKAHNQLSKEDEDLGAEYENYHRKYHRLEDDNDDFDDDDDDEVSEVGGNFCGESKDSTYMPMIHRSPSKKKIHSDTSDFPMYSTSSSLYIPQQKQKQNASERYITANTTVYNPYLNTSDMMRSSDANHPECLERPLPFGIPSSPTHQPIEFMNTQCTLTHELVEDFHMSTEEQRNNYTNNNSNDIHITSTTDVVGMTNSNRLPSSPPLFPMSQSTLVGNQDKPFHSLSRNSSNLAEPMRKRQKLPDNLLQTQQSILQDQQLSHEKLALDRDGKVYGILLQDSTFPEGYSPSLYDDPTFFVVKNAEPASLHASELITSLFDRDPDQSNVTYTLALENIGLNTLPEQIADFKDLVIYGMNGIIKPVLHITASHNNLISITPKLFQIDGLQVLTLRDNKIARVPGAIETCKALKSLNLANNKLKFLPHNILNLKNLEIIRVRPNPLIEARNTGKKCEIDGDCLVDGTVFKNKDRQLKFVGRLHWITKNKQISKSALNAFKLARSLSALQERQDDQMIVDDLTSSSKSNIGDTDDHEEQIYAMKKTQWTPKLTELCLRSISNYLVSQSELMRWKETAHERVFKMAIKSLIHGTNGETCGYCKLCCVEPVAELMEWWDFKDAVLIPIKRRFCSKRCATCWWDDVKMVTK